MLALLILFCVIVSGSLFVSSLFGRRFEESVPLSVFAIIAVLYLFGLFHLLKAGVYVVCAISIVLAALTIRHELGQNQP